MLDALEAKGNISNTLIIYASDNGQLWGEHRYVGKNVPYWRATEVPLYMRWDGRLAAGTGPPARAQRRPDGHHRRGCRCLDAVERGTFSSPPHSAWVRPRVRLVVHPRPTAARLLRLANPQPNVRPLSHGRGGALPLQEGPL